MCKEHTLALDEAVYFTPASSSCFSPMLMQLTPFIFPLLKILFIYFQTEGKGGKKRGRETSMYGFLLCAPPGDLTWLQLRHVPQTGNRTSNPLILRLVLNPLSHTMQGTADPLQCYSTGHRPSIGQHRGNPILILGKENSPAVQMTRDFSFVIGEGKVCVGVVLFLLCTCYTPLTQRYLP